MLQTQANIGISSVRSQIDDSEAFFTASPVQMRYDKSLEKSRKASVPPLIAMKFALSCLLERANNLGNRRKRKMPGKPMRQLKHFLPFSVQKEARESLRHIWQRR